MGTLIQSLLGGVVVACIAIVSLLLAGLFFGARWALEKEWEKESKPSFLREGIIFLASWLWIVFCFIVGWKPLKKGGV